MNKSNKFSNLAKVVYKRTYARNDTGKLETWEETIDRVIAGNVKNHNVSNKEIKRLKEVMMARKAGPAGRGFWFSGAPGHAKLGGVALNNCWGLTGDDWMNLVIAQDLLMLGGGVGLSVEQMFVSKLPKLKKDVIVVHKSGNDADFIVPDSREGWCELTRRTLESFFVTGKSFSYSTVCVRGYGETIHGFGGKASGPMPLIACIDKISTVLKAREGKFARPIDIMDVLCCIGEMVVAGNVRRSAIIILGDPNDKEYLTSKRWDLGPVPNQRAMANLSVVVDSTEDLHPLFWKTYEAGEPFGIVNRKNIRKYGRMGELKKDSAVIVNPCITGETLVSVADGRVAVPIKTLADEGKDVPVHTLAEDGSVAIRILRSPRITGYNVPVLKVTLDNGSSVRVTENHKFLTNDRGYVEAKDLMPGDSLRTLMKRQAPLGLSEGLYWVFYDRAQDSDIFEHRLIGQFKYNIPDGKDICIHHKNHNSLDNSLDNLEMLTRSDHSKEHTDGTYTGDKNPRFSGFTDTELKEHSRILTHSLGRKASVYEWTEYARPKGLPTSFSGWRENHLGGISGMLTATATELGYENSHLDPRTLRKVKELLDEGYDAFVDNYGNIKINKSCEQCHKPIVVAKKGGKYCGSTCTNLSRSKTSYEQMRRTQKQNAETRKQVTRIKQTEVFLDLKQKLGSIPQKNMWAQACREKSISAEMNRPSSPFGSWEQLKEFAANYNHRVVSVEACGVDTVYNGTVDDFSNFFVGGFEESPTKGDKKLCFINNLQCAEATLEDGEPCNLQEIAMPNIQYVEEFEEVARLMHRYGKRVTCEKYHHAKSDEVVKRNRRIGTGITGCLQSSLFNPEDLDRAYKAIQDENVKYSKELGIPESIRTTVVKPSGTISKVFDMNGYEGIHAAYSRYFIQRVRFSATDQLVPLLSAAGHHIEPVLRFDGTVDPNTVVVDFYEQAPAGAPVADEDWTTWKQLDVLKMAQKHWADQAVSVTVYYKREDLPQLKSWLDDNLKYLKTISFLCHNEHGFKQAPKEKITKEEFERLSENISAVDVDNVGTGEDLDGTECVNGACPIK